MQSSKARAVHPPKTTRFVLTRSMGEKISAVEGMKLTGRMRRILEERASGDERRSHILEALRGK